MSTTPNQRRVITKMVSGTVIMRTPKGGFINLGPNDTCEMMHESGKNAAQVVILREDTQRQFITLEFESENERTEFAERMITAITRRE